MICAKKTFIDKKITKAPRERVLALQPIDYAPNVRLSFLPYEVPLKVGKLRNESKRIIVKIAYSYYFFT